MKEFKKYMEKLEHHPEKHKEAKCLANEMAEHLKKYCPESYWAIITKLHCLLHGAHFDEDTAKMAVSKMHNVDGTVGGHWSKEDTDKLAIQHNIEHKCDFYYAMNMLYSDLSEVVGKDAAMHAKMAKALYFDDPDMVEGKLFMQWMAVAFVKEK
ncbi:MAG: hypothetical protein IJZ69_04170 [Bacteroidales bacterium]|nr:hypothetical protein [Bacteroidales bacterium]